MELISKKESRLKLPPKKTIPVWRIIDPYFLEKKSTGTSLKEARIMPKKRAKAAFPIQIEMNINI